MYGAHTDNSLRGDYRRAKADFTVEQRDHHYSDADHALWRRLYARQAQLLQACACREFRDGLALMDAADGVPDLDTVNARLEPASGWRLVAVPGFIPDEQFFRHLAARRFPVTVWLRKPEEFDYLVEPDIFHDFFGHVPMLFDPRFADYAQRYGEQALRLLERGALPLLARLYWYTVEFGLIDGDEGLRVYGAGILSSGGETPYAIESPEPVRLRFELARCMRTEYRIDSFQKTYFVVRSLDELADVMTRDLSALVDAVQAQPTLAAGRLYAGDEAVPPRNGLKLLLHVDEDAAMNKDISHNPLATDGFEFVEFTAPSAAGIAQLHGLFEMMGFTAVAKHRRKDVTLFRQNDINFLVNATPYTHFQQFAQAHGPSACAMGWRVADAPAAHAHAIAQGAVAFDTKPGLMELNLPAVYGIGNSVLYFIDRYGPEHSIYDVDFKFFDGAERAPRGVGLTKIDHLTHNVSRGNMDTWGGFYERIANFREIRYFDIEGKQTGLVSRAMTSPCGKIRIPINESSDDKSQIEEFIREYRGEGIQHIALSSDDIYATVEALRARGVQFMDTPETYYARVDARVPDHGEPLARLRELSILIDGAPVEGILLQIFTSTVIGPIFFEIIQRKGNEGFGEGNFKALFESIEEDQIRRGVLAA